MKIEQRLAHWHKIVAEVGGELATALARRKLPRDAVEDWAERLERAAAEMRDTL